MRLSESVSAVPVAHIEPIAGPTIATDPLAVTAALCAHLEALPGSAGVRVVKPLRRVFGGNQSFVYAVELEGGSDSSLTGRPLILRILRPFLPADSVVREAAVQAALYDLGYPVARIVHYCADASVLGGPFQLMERLAGAPMLLADANSDGTISLRETAGSFAAFVFGDWPQQLADLQRRLHSLSRQAFEAKIAEADIALADLSLGATFERLVARAQACRLNALSDVFEWGATARSFDPERLVCCHGDLFPNQVMNDGRRITGVIDWSDVCLAPREYDVAIVTVGLETLPVPLGAPGRLIVRSRARRFFDAYARHVDLDRELLDHFAIVRAAHSLLGIGERRRRLFADESGPSNPNPYDDERAIAGFVETIREATGIRVGLAS